MNQSISLNDYSLQILITFEKTQSMFEHRILFSSLPKCLVNLVKLFKKTLTITIRKLRFNCSAFTADRVGPLGSISSQTIENI